MRGQEPHRDREPASASKDTTSLRCCCGSLLARLVNDGVELKCRRCKRQVVIPFTAERQQVAGYKGATFSIPKTKL